MDEIKNIQDLLTKWQEADKENRGFILITAGLIENGEAPLLEIINKAKAHLMLRDLARKLNS